MRALLLGLLITFGCATGSPYVNVASVRNDINDTITRDASSGQTTARYIVSMGHTTEQSAVVYTQTSKTSPRREETWVHGATGWKMTDAKDIAGTGTPSPGGATMN
jgi:hypothetical protein